MLSPATWCSSVGIKSELDCFNKPSPKLRDIEKMGSKVCVALLVILINDIANSLNIGKNMGGQQVIDAAQIVLDEFPEMKINDVVYCFHKAKRGHYGIIYDRLDVHVLLSWLHKYYTDQDIQVEAQRHREGNQLKRILNGPLLPAIELTYYMPGGSPIPDTAIPWIQKIRANVDKISSMKKPAIIKMTEDDKQVSKWIAHFNKIYARQDTVENPKPGGIRMIKRYGKGDTIDITAFLKYKSYQLRLVKRRKEDQQIAKFNQEK